MSVKLDGARRVVLTLLCLCAPALLAACAKTSEGGRNVAASNATQTVAPKSDAAQAKESEAVRASATEIQLSPGGSGEALVHLHIAEGFHVNSNQPGDKYLIATEIKAQPADGITPGTPAYPPGVTRKFAFSENPISVYEGEVSIKLPLRAGATATRGRHTLKANVTVQPCSDTECFNPREIDAAIPVVIN